MRCRCRSKVWLHQLSFWGKYAQACFLRPITFVLGRAKPRKQWRWLCKNSVQCRPASTLFDSAQQPSQGICISTTTGRLKVRPNIIITSSQQKPCVILSYKSFYYKAASQEMTWRQQKLNTTPQTAEREHDKTVKRSRCLKVQTGQEKHYHTDSETEDNRAWSNR